MRPTASSIVNYANRYKEISVGDNVSVFDREQLLKSTRDDEELAGQVVGLFLTDIPEQPETLEGALGAGDAKTAERVAHSIKGASATVGGMRLYETAFTCEQLGREARPGEFRVRVDDLRREYRELREALLAAGFSDSNA